MDKWEELRTICPRLYRQYVAFECLFGWFDILKDLSIKIEKILEELVGRKLDEGKEEVYIEMFAVQVKEKYGTLRFYMSCETDEISGLIEKAELLSSETCEACGKQGKKRGKKWFSVRCDNCYNETKEVPRR